MAESKTAYAVQEENLASPSPTPFRLGKSEFVTRMFDDPKVKKVFREQRMLQLKQIYTEFVKERHFDSRRSAQFFDLLTDGELNEIHDGLRLFQNDKSDSNGNVAEAQASATETAGIDRQLRLLLGDADYAAYQAYERTIGDRMVLAQVREQIGLAGSPLRDDQAKTLLQIMTEERTRTPPTSFNPHGQGTLRDRFTPLLENDNGERYVESQADLNRRIRDRIGVLLSPEQFAAFERFQEQQLAMEKISMEMTRELIRDNDDDTAYGISVQPSSDVPNR